jgi:hypothetical protein
MAKLTDCFLVALLDDGSIELQMVDAGVEAWCKKHGKTLSVGLNSGDSIRSTHIGDSVTPMDCTIGWIKDMDAANFDLTIGIREAGKGDDFKTVWGDVPADTPPPLPAQPGPPDREYAALVADGQRLGLDYPPAPAASEGDDLMAFFKGK